MIIKKNKIKNKKLYVILSILAVFVIVAGYFGVRFWMMTSGSVPFAEGNSTSSMHTKDPSLQLVSGVPSDIDKDYDDGSLNEKVPIYKIVPINKDIINILLIGSDARPGQSTGRADSQMILSYNRIKKSVTLVSLMRDSWVNIPNYGWERLNVAYARGGPGLAINTINSNFGIDIQNYVTIQFSQFARLVDDFGGLELNLTKSEAERINSILNNKSVKEVSGKQLLHGKQVLALAQNRRYANGDFERTKRQREIMLSLYNKFRSNHDPIKITKLFTFALDNVKTNIDSNTLYTLMTETLNTKNLQIKQARIPFDKTWSYARKDGKSVLSLDLVKNRELLKDILY